MKSICLNAALNGEDRVRLSGSDYHHLVRVARYKNGDRLKAIDPEGFVYDAVIREITESDAVLEIVKEAAVVASIPGASLPGICLVQSLPKGKKMDLIIRQATEAGVSAIQPVLTRYSVVKLESCKDAEKKAERWARIAKEAVKQSGTRQVPVIGSPTPLEELSFEKGALVLFFHEKREGSVPLHTALSNDYKMIYILIGPEGGFSGDEARWMADRGFIPVWLGENVLRTETASLYAIASVITILSEIQTWRKSGQG